MGKSLFPLNPEPEDDKFIDPDSRFNSLPYSTEIPEPYTESLKVPPFNIQFIKYQTCREKIITVGTFGFAIGWAMLGNALARAVHGNAVTRWRLLWCNVQGAIVGTALGMVSASFADLNCSPFATGRRRNLFYDESIRHAINAKFGLYKNLEKIMMSKERISRLEFYEAFQRTYEATEKSYESLKATEG